MICELLRVWPKADLGDSAMDTTTLLRRIEPDIALVSAGRGGGIDLVRRLLADRPSLQVLALSDRANAEVANRAMAAGAIGCISKTAVVAELVIALEMVKKGERYVGSEIARSLVLSRFAGSADNPLSQAEREILHLIAEGKSLREIAAALHTPYKRLANACARLKSKVGARSMTELVAIACNLKTE